MFLIFLDIIGYAFNVTNPDEVLKGMKPVLQEVGPFVYKAVTVKNSRNNIVFNEDGETLTYRPRFFFMFIYLFMYLLIFKSYLYVKEVIAKIHRESETSMQRKRDISPW